MKKFIGFNLSPLRLVLSAGIAEKSLAQSSLLPTHWVIILVFSRFNSPISQPLLMRQRLWSFGPFPDSVWYVHACSPELDAVLQTWSLQCWGQGKDPPPLPAGDAFPNAAQGTAGCLCHEGELLARGQLTGTRTTRSLSAKLISSWSVPSIYWCLGQILLRGRTLGVPLLIFVRLLLARFSNLLNDCTLFWYISYSFQFSIICNLLKVHSVSPFRLLMKELNKICPSIDPWGTPIVTGLQLDSCHWWQCF